MTAFYRTASYANRLTKAAAAQASIQLSQRSARAAAVLQEIESRRKADLDRVYYLIHRSAHGGGVRIFNWDWTTAKEDRHLLFEDKEIQKYLEGQGFSYTYNAIEWYHAPTNDELR